MTLHIHHLNCGTLHAPPNPRAACHCLLVECDRRLVLVDTGIGLLDVADPPGRIGAPLIEIVGFQFREEETAARQIERLGFRVEDVSDIVLTHGDPDHTGGLADFPAATVHISTEEQAQLATGHWRYLPAHFSYGPKWQPIGSTGREWFGLEARPVPLAPDDEVLLVPLTGHTLGHCGVAIRQRNRWLLHVGDGYYLRVELTTDDHPVSLLTAQRADDDAQRRKSLAHLRRLATEHGDEIELFGYHDFGEFPGRDSPAANT